MKIRFTLAAALCLTMIAAGALAAKAPYCERSGSKAHAEHLYAKHVYAYTDGWDGVNPAPCEDEGCLEYGHVRCYGRQVRLTDTPAGGKSRVPYYPYGFDGYVGPDTQFQLVDMLKYGKKYFANIRVLDENGSVVNSGFVNADYIGCDCETVEGREEVAVYEHNPKPFSLR